MTEKGALPPGWEIKYAGVERKPYFVNHITKTTTWTDPRDEIDGFTPTKANVEDSSTTRHVSINEALGLQEDVVEVLSPAKPISSPFPSHETKNLTPIANLDKTSLEA